jgi:hypothetical protein
MVGVQVAVGVLVIVGVKVGLGVIDGVGVIVGPKSCPGPQADIVTLMIKRKNVTACRVVFILSPVAVMIALGGYSREPYYFLSVFKAAQLFQISGRA